MRDLLNAEDWMPASLCAKEQEREGAHILDVNVDFSVATVKWTCTSGFAPGHEHQAALMF